MSKEACNKAIQNLKNSIEYKKNSGKYKTEQIAREIKNLNSIIKYINELEEFIDILNKEKQNLIDLIDDIRFDLNLLKKAYNKIFFQRMFYQSILYDYELNPIFSESYDFSKDVFIYKTAKKVSYHNDLQKLVDHLIKENRHCNDKDIHDVLRGVYDY